MAILDIYWPVLLAVKTSFQLINSDYMSKGRMIVSWYSGLFLHLEIFPYEGVDRACSPHMKYKTGNFRSVQFSSVTQSCLTLWDPMDCSTPGFSVHHQLPELNQTHIHRISDAIQPFHPLSFPFFSCLQSFPASGSFPMSQIFASGGQSIGASASASILPLNIQDWFPLEWTCWISFQPERLSRAFSNITVQKHEFFSTQLSLWSTSNIHTWLLEKT